MTSRSQCDFKGCLKTTSHWDSFFKKWACEDHAFNEVVWPNLGIEQKMKENSLNEYDRQLQAEHKGKNYKPKKNSSHKWGKRYF